MFERHYFSLYPLTAKPAIENENFCSYSRPVVIKGHSLSERSEYAAQSHVLNTQKKRGNFICWTGKTLLFNSEHETNNSIVKRKLQKWWTEKEAESTFYMLDRNNTIQL